MIRIIGIISAVVGILVAVFGFTGILPHLGSTGIILVLFGGLLFGLSFIPKPVAVESAPMSFPETLAKMFFAPTEVFQNLRRFPRFLGVILVMSIISGIYTTAFFYHLTPERIANYQVDKTAESGFAPEEMMPKIRQDTIEAYTNPMARAGQLVNGFVGQVFFIAFVGFMFWLIIMAFGGTINFWQSVSATAYAFFPVILLQKGISTLILFLKDPVDVHPILGQNSLVQDSLNFLIAPSASPVLYTVLSSFSLLAIYSIWLIATGLKNTGERVSPTAAWSASIFLWVAGLSLGAIMAFFFGGFMT